MTVGVWVCGCLSARGWMGSGDVRGCVGSMHVPVIHFPPSIGMHPCFLYCYCNPKIHKPASPRRHFTTRHPRELPANAVDTDSISARDSFRRVCGAMGSPGPAAAAVASRCASVGVGEAVRREGGWGGAGMELV